MIRKGLEPKPASMRRREAARFVAGRDRLKESESREAASGRAPVPSLQPLGKDQGTSSLSSLRSGHGVAVRFRCGAELCSPAGSSDDRR